MNLCLEYLYRDAGNNKIWGEIVFANEHRLDVAEVTAQISPLLIDGHFFEAEAIPIPPCYFDKVDIELDHGWHEFSAFSETAEAVTDAQERDITEFIRSFESAAQSWKQYT